jgi:hypothetical protein
LNIAFGIEHNANGTHDSTKVATLSGTQTFTGDKTFDDPITIKQVSTPSNPSSGYNKIYFKSDNKLYKLTSGGVEAEVGGASFWADVPGTPTRVSDTQFTITDTGNANKYNKLFQKGVVLKWSESGTTNLGMVISSSYSSNTVTINIVGDSLSSGFTSMKYCLNPALVEQFIIPGTLATGTDLAKTFYAPTNLCPISVDARVKTAGTTNATVFDVNDDGVTIITTKPSIASGTTSDLDNTVDSPTTAIAKDSLITIDIDSVSTTAPVEAYIYLYYIPENWLYRS